MHEWNAALIDEAVDSVLETMFFSTTMGEAEQETGGNVLKASVTFDGRPSGRLDVRLSRSSARSLAAAFLGEEENALTPDQPGEVLCEMANILCGALVSKLDGDEVFHLYSPRLEEGEEGVGFGTAGECAVSRSFALENGVLTVRWQSRVGL